jgi:hypothetical protein
MSTILILLAIGALTGLALGFNSSWAAVFVSGTILAILAATVLQKAGVGPVAGIATIMACLTVNQLGYLAGAVLRARGKPKAPASTVGRSRHHWVR